MIDPHQNYLSFVAKNYISCHVIHHGNFCLPYSSLLLSLCLPSRCCVSLFHSLRQVSTKGVPSFLQEVIHLCICILAERKNLFSSVLINLIYTSGGKRIIMPLLYRVKTNSINQGSLSELPENPSQICLGFFLL